MHAKLVMLVVVILVKLNVAIYLAILCCLQCLLCACQSALNGNTCLCIVLAK